MKLTFSKVDGAKKLVIDGVWNLRFFYGNLSFDANLDNEHRHLDIGYDKIGKFYVYSKTEEGKTKRTVYERLEIE